MGRAVVHQRQLPGFLLELREKGVTRISREPARFDGSVAVRWSDPGAPLGDAGYRADLQAFVPAFVLSGAFVLFLVLVFGLVTFLTGGLAGP
ncbi:MAG: hypothetical protein AMXMBFR53_25350 [Gemmatimonadota bacterium]